MSTPLERVRRGALVLAVTLCLSVIGYKVLDERSWTEAIYMVVITVSTVGFGERSGMSPTVQWFTIMVVLFGLSATVYTIGGFLEMAVEGEVGRAMGRARQSRGLARLNEHVIVCGFGRMGQMLVGELQQFKIPFVLIERDPERAAEARELGDLVIVGDATEEDILNTAGIERARTLATTLPDDAANVFIVLTGRNMNQRLQIIARGEFPSTQKKLVQAGADRVVLSAAIGASRMAAMITRPATLDLMDLAFGQTKLDIELCELTIPSTSVLVGEPIDAGEARRHKLLVVAIKPAAGETIFNPDASVTIGSGDRLVVMGNQDDIGRFVEEFL